MNTQLEPDQRSAAIERPAPPWQPEAARRHPTREKLLDPDGVYRRPTCLLAIAIREVGETATVSSLARAAGNDSLSIRAKREQEGWSGLYEFTSRRICPALRMQTVAPEAASVVADAALASMPPTVPADILAFLRRHLTVCAGYSTADDCPFLNPLPADAAL